MEYLFWLSLTALIVIIVLAGIRILLPSYDDGFVGKFLLCLMMIAAFSEAEKIWNYPEYHEYAATAVGHAWIYICVALLQARHFVRFIAYNYGRFQWFVRHDRRSADSTQRRTLDR